MSADNAYAVWFDRKTKQYNIAHVFMSPLMDNCQYLAEIQPNGAYKTREEAIVAAHDMVKTDSVVEYGVIEESIPDKPCGRCWVCVHDRNIVSNDMIFCNECDTPLVGGYTLAFGKQLCNKCYIMIDSIN